jgi:hypothetical protein
MADELSFREKLEYWRNSGHSPFAAQSESFFHGPTQREIVRDITDSARAEGREIAPVNSTWV